MALVERAHGRHEADRAAAGASGCEQGGELLAGVREDGRRGHRRRGAGADGRAARSGARRVEDPAHRRGADRQQPAVGDDAVEGGARHGDVRRQRLRRVGGDVGEVGADGVDVAAHDRAGQGGVALLEGVVEGGGEQRAQGGGGVVGTGGGEQLHRLGDQGDEVVGAVGEAGVVERAALLGDPHRRGRRGRRPGARRARARPSPAVSAEDAAAQAVAGRPPCR